MQMDSWKSTLLSDRSKAENSRNKNVPLLPSDKRVDFQKNPSASICTAEGVDKFKDIANFQDYHGLPEFRQAEAKFMSRARGGRVTFVKERF
ncbi:hypothetical protein QYF36_026935 [Acer negundo]|nr:hypothetical protein QYF36_026935 [Acer negundo]